MAGTTALDKAAAQFRRDVEEAQARFLAAVAGSAPGAVLDHPGGAEGSPVYSRDYEHVWAEWLRLRGKGTKHDGWRAWQRLTPRPSAPAVVSTFAAWWATKPFREGFVPHLSTFLNRRQWETPANPPIVAPPPAPVQYLSPPTRPQQDLAADVERSWRQGWAEQFPGRAWPGRAEAIRLIKERAVGGRSMVAGLAEAKALPSGGKR